MPEPFQRLVNQGMILGEMEDHRLPGRQRQVGERGEGERPTRRASTVLEGKRQEAVTAVPRRADAGQKKGEVLCAGRRAVDPAGEPVPTRCPRAAAMCESGQGRGRVRSRFANGYTRCSWVRWKPPSHGAWKASTAYAGFLDRVWRIIVNEPQQTMGLTRRCKLSRRPSSRTASCIKPFKA